jgi:hypothetical protein
VLELADLFEVHARDLASGSRTVPSFEDALFMQRLLEQAAVSSASGHRIKLQTLPRPALRLGANHTGRDPSNIRAALRAGER